VTDQTLRRLLEQNQQQVKATLASYLRERLAGSTISELVTRGGFGLRVSGRQPCDIAVLAGMVQVTTSYDRGLANELSSELTELLTLLGQQLFEQAVAAYIEQHYRVEQSQPVGDQLVITFNI